MINPFSTFIFMYTGALIIWIAKGRKGPLENELVRIGDSNSAKGTVRTGLGVTFWILVGLVIIAIARANR
jgi:hypothetical protein